MPKDNTTFFEVEDVLEAIMKCIRSSINDGDIEEGDSISFVYEPGKGGTTIKVDKKSCSDDKNKENSGAKTMGEMAKEIIELLEKDGSISDGDEITFGYMQKPMREMHVRVSKGGREVIEEEFSVYDEEINDMKKRTAEAVGMLIHEFRKASYAEMMDFNATALEASKINKVNFSVQLIPQM